jgi:hypothetical protein
MLMVGTQSLGLESKQLDSSHEQGLIDSNYESPNRKRSLENPEKQRDRDETRSLSGTRKRASRVAKA